MRIYEYHMLINKVERVFISKELILEIGNDDLET